MELLVQISYKHSNSINKKVFYVLNLIIFKKQPQLGRKSCPYPHTTKIDPCSLCEISGVYADVWLSLAEFELELTNLQTLVLSADWRDLDLT